jgi:hypothetical protein
MNFKMLRWSLALIFVIMAGASLFVTYNATYVLSVAYAVTNRVTVSGATLDLNDTDPAEPKLNFTIVIENPTTTNLHLAYIKLTAYVFESEEVLMHGGDPLLNRDILVHVYDPKASLNAVSNTTLSLEITNVEDFLAIDTPKYWMMAIYLHLPDAPLLGNKAILKRYAYFETSF